MIPGLYSAATAMDAASARHEASAENLAHSHLPGFRRRIVQQSTFSTLLEGRQDADRFAERLGTRLGDGPVPGNELKIDFTHGFMKQTGRNLDVAIEGDSFFAVDGPDGPLYTRNGSFRATPDGNLVTVDGLTVRGRSGTISIPPNTPSEAISVAPDGRLLVDGVEFGQLETVTFEDQSRLVTKGASLFHAPAGLEPEQSDETMVSGFVESANVAHMDELVNILVASRQYEAAQKALKTLDESLNKHINGGR